MDDEDGGGAAHVILNTLPLILVEVCAKVVSGDREVNLVITIDLSLRVAQRREQT